MTAPHTKTSRDEWLDAAIDALADQPIDQLKVLVLAERLGVARSSFYWYFRDRKEFDDALVERWRVNTASVVDRTNRPADTLTAACLGVFECWADRRLFDVRLDQAMREWASRDAATADKVRIEDDARVAALTAMFERHGFDGDRAIVRARLLYHGQIGYHLLSRDEPLARRVELLPEYLLALTGEMVPPAELQQFEHFLRSLREVQRVGRSAR